VFQYKGGIVNHKTLQENSSLTTNFSDKKLLVTIMTNLNFNFSK